MASRPGPLCHLLGPRAGGAGAGRHADARHRHREEHRCHEAGRLRQLQLHPAADFRHVQGGAGGWEGADHQAHQRWPRWGSFTASGHVPARKCCCAGLVPGLADSPQAFERRFKKWCPTTLMALYYTTARGIQEVLAKARQGGMSLQVRGPALARAGKCRSQGSIQCPHASSHRALPGRRNLRPRWAGCCSGAVRSKTSTIGSWSASPAAPSAARSVWDSSSAALARRHSTVAASARCGTGGRGTAKSAAPAHADYWYCRLRS